MATRLGLVKQRRSRLSYGILTQVQYDPEKHGSEDITQPKRDKFDDTEIDLEVIDWLVRKVGLFHTKLFVLILDI